MKLCTFKDMLMIAFIKEITKRLQRRCKDANSISRIEWYERISKPCHIDQLFLPFEHYSVNREEFFQWTNIHDSLLPPLGIESLPKDLKKIIEIIRCQKLLEFYLTLSLTKLSKDNVVVDIGSANSLFLEYIHKKIGCHCIAVDPCLKLQNEAAGVKFQSVLISEALLPPCDLICLHCSYEMFSPDEMVQVFIQASKAIRHGGKLIIAPLYLSNYDTIFYDINRGVNLTYLEKIIKYNPKLIGVKDFWNLDWCEFISPKRLTDLNKNAVNFRFNLLRINCGEIHPKLWLNNVGVWNKI
jgi:hypothetical protein